MAIKAYYPDVIGLGKYYGAIIDDAEYEKLKPATVSFLKGEIKRMAIINAIVAEMLVEKRPKKTWIKDFEDALLRQFFERKKLKTMSSAEKKNFIVSLMFPKP
jgi:hypothetical protein